MAIEGTTLGTMELRRPGIWRCRYRVDGERRFITVAASGKKEARRLVEDQKRQRAEQAEQDATWTVAKVAQRWLKGHEPTLASPLSKVHYRNRVKKYIVEQPIGSMKAALLKRLDVEDYRSAMLERYSASTAKAGLDMLKQSLEWAVENKIALTNVARKVKNPARPEPTRRPFTPDEFDRILATQAYDLQRQCALILSVLSLRRGEVTGLRLEDVDVDADKPVLHIKQQCQQHVRVTDGKPAKTLFYPPKESSRRTFGIPPLFVPYLAAQKKWRLSLGTECDLFLVSAAKGFEAPFPADCAAIVHDACAAAGIDPTGLVFHSGRHSYATWSQQAGTPGVDISRVAGWANDNMRVLLYGAHPDQNRNAVIAQEFNDYLSPMLKIHAQKVSQEVSQEAS